MAFRFLELKEGCSFAQLCFSGTIFALTQVASMMQEDPEDRVDPMARVFPRVTKCTFKKFGLKFQIIYFQNFQSLLLKKGPSGTLQTHDSLCVLPVNIINEVCHSPISFEGTFDLFKRFNFCVKFIVKYVFFVENLRVPVVLAAHPWCDHLHLSHVQLFPLCHPWT